MLGPVETVYFDWLCEKVLNEETQSFRDLMEILYAHEFVWVVSADKHRLADGKQMRTDYLRENFKVETFPPDENRAISVLEVFIAFADRCSFATSIPASDWFWEFLNNLRLDRFDRVTVADLPLIEEILYIFTWRLYESDGTGGGMFPLRDTHRDQRQQELWFQFCEYVQDRHLI